MFLWTNLALLKSEQIHFDNILYNYQHEMKKKFDCKLYVYQTMILYKLLNVDNNIYTSFVFEQNQLRNVKKKQRHRKAFKTTKQILKNLTSINGRNCNYEIWQ